MSINWTSPFNQIGLIGFIAFAIHIPGMIINSYQNRRIE